MRILLLTSSFHPLTGGAESYARTLAAGLASEGHQVVVATDGHDVAGLPLSERVDGYEVLRPRAYSAEVDRKDKVRWRQMQYAVLSELSGLLGEQRFDVVHSNSHECLVLGSIVALEQGAALVASLHEQNPQSEPFGLGRSLLSYRTLPVDLFLAASDFYAQRCTASGVPREAVRKVYHGVTVPEPRPDAWTGLRTRLGATADTPLIVCPARIYTRKDQLTLVEAMARVRVRVPTARLLLAGRVSDQLYAQRLAQLTGKLGLTDAVHIIEDFANTDMPDVLGAADLVALPSLEEGLGLAAIEAMALGRPVVGTDVVGLREVLTDRHDALVVPPRSPDRLGAALTRLLLEPALARELGEEARRTVQKRFSASSMVLETIRCYREAVDRRAERP
ncbi:glycosyltransferase family 4 protein [Streptomyces albidoflavus]